MKALFRPAARAIFGGSILFCLGLPAPAKDLVLTIGGGSSPSSNQISLERNVIFFSKLLTEQLPPDTTHDLYFSDGDSPNPDLQFEPKDHGIPKSNLLAAALFGSTKNIKLQYRDNKLDQVRGPSTPGEIEAWFKKTGSKLVTGDRLILYVTAHGGGSSNKKNNHDTRIHMWNGTSIVASKLAELVAGLPEGVSVVTIMVQCYSGGFANLIFENADSEKGLAPRNICGFYSTFHNRLAAGCTPDINEEDYDEYSSHFWAALRGKTRGDKEVPFSDYNGDGEISFEEAHAFTLLNSKTIDIPIKTSGAFLRRHSKTEEKSKPDLDLLHPEKTPYFQLLSHARPADLAVLDHLSARFELTGTHRGEEVRKKAEEIGKKRKELEKQANEKKKTIGTLRNEIRRGLIARWPQLTNLFSPDAMALISERADEFVQAAEAHPKFAEWETLTKERTAIESERFQLEKTWAHHKRFTRILENVALAANLDKVSDAETTARYQKLVAAEASSFVTPPAATPTPVEVKVEPEAKEEVATPTEDKAQT